jgi:Tfp pilus assembly protein PilO
MQTEIQSLQNAINHYGLNGYKIHECFQLDKRIKKSMYFLTDADNVSLTGKLDYTQLNHFISGYGQAFKKFKTT